MTQIPVKQPEAQKPEKRKRGHPPFKYDLEQVEALAGRGLTKAEIALCLGCHSATLFNKQKEDPEFAAAMERGKAKAIAAASGKLMKHIQDGHVVALMFWLKCRAGWKETSVLEFSDPPPLPGSDCSTEEAERAYYETMRATT